MIQRMSLSLSKIIHVFGHRQRVSRSTNFQLLKFPAILRKSWKIGAGHQQDLACTRCFEPNPY